MSALALDAEALYAELLRGAQGDNLIQFGR